MTIEGPAVWGLWNYAIVGAGVILAVYAVAPKRILRSLTPQRARITNFDTPIRDAIRHVIHTTPHSYQTAQNGGGPLFRSLV